MNISLKIFLLVLLLLLLFLIIKTIKSKKLSMKYGSFWIFLIIIMVIIVIFPQLLFKISNIFGFEVASNMIFLLGFFFLFYIIFILTISLSIQNNKIKTLIQEISILKESVKNGKKE